MRLLLVEDNQLNVEFFSAVLEAEGHQLTIERDGVRGRERALAESFDLILLDIQLPGLNGNDLCRDLRVAGLTTPILAVSSAALPRQVSEGHDSGFTEYLTKPITPSELRDAVRNHGVGQRG